MNLINKIFKAISLLLISYQFSFAQSTNPRDNIQGSSSNAFRKVGAAGSEFLKIGVGARSNGMSGAFSAISNDLTALFYNSAGLVDVNGYAANISYGQWFGGYTHNYLAGVVPAGDKYKVGISITSFSSGDIPLTTLDKENLLNITYTVSDFCLGGTFAAMLTDHFSFGVTMKYVQSSISLLSSSGVVADVGTLYRFGGYRIGFSISNLGGQFQYGGEELNQQIDPTLPSQKLQAALSTTAYNLPLSFKAGIATDLTSELLDMYESREDLGAGVAREHRWLLSADFETLSDVPEQFAIGTEYVWNDLLSVRGGYRLGHDQFNLSAGLGIRYTGGGFDGSLDYSIQPTKTLGLVNRITLGLRLN
ncbi:MAG: PorV/PorQ family protein [Candidatus Kapabacteria bacterium]|nr:PorV/PorQ family protein [Candidatus Kapabacteria bacterium]